MPRPLRFLPTGALVEVTLRTVQGRFLLRPSARLNDLVLGVIGRAQRKYGMRIHAFVVLSNHLHLAVSPDSPQQLAAFMGYVAGNVAREAGRLHHWREKFWSRRYRAIVVSCEEEAQVARLAYILGNSVKEGLVSRPQHWPGAHCAHALLHGKALAGTWYDRTAEYQARARGELTARAGFAQPEWVVLSPLPCWAKLDAAACRQRVAELLRKIVEDARPLRSSRAVLGRRAILAQRPHDVPRSFQRSSAPLVHAATRAVRTALRTAYYEFVSAYREAAHRLRCGDRLARFPAGAFPPPLPCVLTSS